MSRSKTRVNKLVDEIQKRWFPDHVAEFVELAQGSHAVGMLRWRKPGTGIYAITYLIHQNSLFVAGDLGEAVYRWSSDISWEFLAGCSLDYFHEKCEASETGRDFCQWDSQDAVEWFYDRIQSKAEEKASEDDEDFDRLADDAKKEYISKVEAELNDAIFHSRSNFREYLQEQASTESEFQRFLIENQGDLQDCLNIELCDVGDPGNVIDPCAIAHWLGINMAIEQRKVCQEPQNVTGS